MTTLRPYQQRAIASTQAGWRDWQRQLGVAATGAGKTILFSHLVAVEPGRSLILAHREELVTQAARKLHASTGVWASVERADERAHPGSKVIVASVQSMRRRLKKYAPDAFDLVIVDEAHHSLADEWAFVLNYFRSARILGVTATPDRSDRKQLGGFYQNIAFEIGLLELIGDGYLAPLRSLRLDVELDGSQIKLRHGDISTNDAAGLVSPKVKELASAVAAEIWDRKALIFLPRCDVSEAFALELSKHGIRAKHVSGASDDRAGLVDWFRPAGPGSALCNAMLLTEGFDLDAARLGLPEIDCIVCLRPTRSRSLYAQIVGRGTRIAPGKECCLLLDPLWLSGTIDLCKPADLLANNRVHRDKLQARLDEGLDILAAEKIARVDVEEALAKALEESAKLLKAPKGLIDPLAWAVGIHDSDLSEYEPSMPWEEEAPTPEQTKRLVEAGLWTERVTRGFAVKLLERIEQREALGLATPKQVAKLRQLGEPNADVMTKAQAGFVFGRKFRRAA